MHIMEEPCFWSWQKLDTHQVVSRWLMWLDKKKLVVMVEDEHAKTSLMLSAQPTITGTKAQRGTLISPGWKYYTQGDKHDKRCLGHAR